MTDPGSSVLEPIPGPGAIVTRHGTVDLDRRTAVMGILNVTPDSFYDGGRRTDPAKAVDDALRLVEAGADIVDVGGESTRPGAHPVSVEEELARVLPVIRGLRRSAAVPISIDTYKAEVARAALAEGADIINDISALRFDDAMAALAAAEEVPVVLMHMQGTPQTMQKEPRYGDVVAEVRAFLAERMRTALAAGIAERNLIVDPGIGFGKTLEHNLALLRGLPALASLGAPLLVGVSRKAFIGRILGLEAGERLEGSLAAAAAAVLAGARIVRAHDVLATRRAVAIADAIRYGAREP
ncbi:MAG TPA: dihydropteroate synthase [candidate division Zixibacteria bacterium]|nr:dihydropteroate synthase [candidate division Zixibacteria bacterium]